MSTERQDHSCAPKFALGRVVATPAAIELMATTATHAQALLSKHACGEWGDISAEDARENARSVVEGLRILSAYRLPLCPQNQAAAAWGQDKRGCVWIITEADRSITTLLLPSEY
jgi:hypothetical protein